LPLTVSSFSFQPLTYSKIFYGKDITMSLEKSCHSNQELLEQILERRVF